MGSKAQAKKNSEFAKAMKDRGIRRTTGICCICYKTISVLRPTITSLAVTDRREELMAYKDTG